MATKRNVIKTCQIGRFDGELHSVGFNTDDTIETIAQKAGFTLGKGESVNNSDGDSILGTAKPKANGVYFITGNYKQG